MNRTLESDCYILLYFVMYIPEPTYWTGTYYQVERLTQYLLMLSQRIYVKFFTCTMRISSQSRAIQSLLFLFILSGL